MPPPPSWRNTSLPDLAGPVLSLYGDHDFMERKNRNEDQCESVTPG
jgi:hypothetical protein